jgi:hypothetical protein
MSKHRIICFTHRQYTGQESPILTCKVCCGIFVASMKAKIAAKESQLAASYGGPSATPLATENDGLQVEHGSFSFNPGSI